MDPVYLQNAQATKNPGWFEENPLGWTMEPKYDGFRCEVVRDETGVHLYSRTLKSQDRKFPEIERMLMKVPEGTILDGELLFPAEDGWMEVPGNGRLLVACDFQKTKMIAGSKIDEALRKQEQYGSMYLVLFDCLMFEGKDVRGSSLSLRQEYLWRATELVGDTVMVAPRLVPSTELVEEMISRGAEGVMFKNLGSRYESSKRPSNNWYKYKMTDTVDVVVMGYTKAHKWHTELAETCPECGGKDDIPVYWSKYTFGMNAGVDEHYRVMSEGTTCPGCGGRITQFWLDGLIGAVKFGQYKDGKLVPRGRCSGMTLAQRREFTENQGGYLGKVIEVQHMGLTSGSLRHPQFVRIREDKRPEECEGTWK